MSTPTRQTYIGCDGGNLTIVDADKPRPEKEFVLRLPEEILQQIIKSAALERTWFGRSGYNYDINFLSKLARTCRRLRSSVLPLMYRELSIDTETRSSYRRQQLRLPLEEPTMLLFQAHCQELHVHITDLHPPLNAPFPLLRDLVCHLPNVHKLTVHGGYQGHPREAWALIRLALQDLPHVRSLELDREAWGLHLRDAFRHIESSSLQSLNLHGISRPKGARDEDYMLAEKKRTAPITSISLSDYEESALATEQLIQWPKALTHFHFGHYYNNPFYMDLPLFTTWLLPHRETLRSINIGYLSSNSGGLLFNASAFPKLETLTLSRWQIGQRQLPYAPDTADYLLAPSMHTFSLDFSIYDQHSEDLTAFMDPEEQWVRAFARDALARRARLRRIKIEFTPEYYLPDVQPENGYPWDRMDKLCDEFSPHGLVVEYNEPTLAKEQWLLEAGKPRDRGPEYGAAAALERVPRPDIRRYFDAV